MKIEHELICDFWSGLTLELLGNVKQKITETVESEHLGIGPKHLYDFDSDTIYSLNLFIISILFYRDHLISFHITEKIGKAIK